MKLMAWCNWETYVYASTGLAGAYGRYKDDPEGEASRPLVSPESRDHFTSQMGVERELVWDAPKDGRNAGRGNRNHLIGDHKIFADQGDDDMLYMNEKDFAEQTEIHGLHMSALINEAFFDFWYVSQTDDQMRKRNGFSE